ncbi:hypothetical protein NRP93_000780 [Clostridium botulinum]|nr:hypothetical protein [Clostridium botulinum]
MFKKHVKLYDLSDNMDLSKIKNPTQNDYERIEKYCKAANRILWCYQKKNSIIINII